MRLPAVCVGAHVGAVVLCAAGLRAQEPDPQGRDRESRSYVAADYSYTWFRQGPDPWQLASLSVGHRGGIGSLIGRVNFADRFGQTGLQYEADAYPRLRQGLYAYLNLGWSEDRLFPRWRSGGELFTNLPRSWEASLGYRQLRFSGTPVTLFTGSVGKYVGNNWYSLRPFVRFRDDGVSASLGLTARMYTVDEDHYVGARVSAGTSPSDRVDPTELERTNSWSAGVHGSGTVAPRVLGKWSVGYEHEQLSRTNTRRRWEGSIGLRVDFRRRGR